MLKISEEDKNNDNYSKNAQGNPNDNNFKILGNEYIEIVERYTYLLGTRLASTGNFTLALEHLKEKALHAFFNIQKHTLLNRLNPSRASQIFNTIIFPILTYNSEE